MMKVDKHENLVFKLVKSLQFCYPSLQKSDIKSKVETDNEQIHQIWEDRRGNPHSANRLQCDEGRQAGKVVM